MDLKYFTEAIGGVPTQGSLGISNGWKHNNVLAKQGKEGPLVISQLTGMSE